jgi:hypothetical protein
MFKTAYTALIDKHLLIGIFAEKENLADLFHRSHRRIAVLEKNFDAAVFFFSPHDINYQTYFINGAYFNRKRGCWEHKTFRFPDVIYLYSGLPKLHQADQALFMHAVEKLKVRIVNKLLELNKWEVYRALRHNSALRPHLPETILCREQRKDLETMLRKYGGAYLKACRGRRGQQVMQVTWLRGGSYEYRYFVGKLATGKVNMNELLKVINRFFRGRDFIIQEPIDLIKYQGRKVDLRAEVQRNGRGELEIVAVPVRVSQADSPITTHGSSYRFEDFFTQMMNYSESSLHGLKSRLHDLLLKIYCTVEQYAGPSGEFGIDIGLDNKDRLWFIECNPLSARVSLINAYDEKTVGRAFSNALAYVLHRSGGRFS